MKKNPSTTEPSAHQNPGEIPIPPNLQNKLESFRSRLWSVKIAEGALAGIVGLALSYLLVFIVDRFVDTPVLIRWTILGLGFAVPALGIPLRWHRWVWKQRTLEQVARLLKRRYPRLGDQLLGIVELAHEGRTDDGAPSAHSRTLVDAAMLQVDEKIKDKDFSDAVPNNHYGRWMAATIAVLAVSGAALFFVSDAAQNALARWVTPWKLVPRYTFAKLKPVPPTIYVPYAEKFDLQSQLRQNTEWKPDSASVRLSNRAKFTTARGDTDAYHFDLPPQKEDGTLSLRVGDAREKILVNPLVRPELTDLNAQLQLPAYLMYESDPIMPVRGGSVSILKGTTTTFTANTSRDLAFAHADGKSIEVSGSAFSTAPAKITYSQSREFIWEDIRGLKAKSPLKLRVNAVEDEAPDVFARKLSKEQVVLESEVVSFDIKSGDDFGIRKVGLEWVGVKDPSRKNQPDKGEKLVSAGKPEVKEIEARGTFSAAREKVKPQILHLRAFAEDYLPNRPRTYSQMFVLHVLNPQDHATWLTGEFGKWFRHTREVYEREQQLYESNKELRKLSAEELDRPTNRRKIEKQARAESNNARRLDSLSNSGRELVRQAAKNDEFDAERMESWATMMRALDEIAKKRMPSVADLLKKSSQAAGGNPSKQKPEQQKQNGKSKPAGPTVKNDKSNDNGKAGDNKKPSHQPPPPPVPSISDKESSFAEDKPKSDDPKKPDAPSKPKKGRLTIPGTTLKGIAGNEDDKKQEAETPAQEKLDEALTEQKNLIEEFAKVAEQLQEILSSLEASTFVKRFKAASRKQLAVATDLNKTLAEGFGLTKENIIQRLSDVGEKTSEIETEESETVYTIQSDLDAYFQRKQDIIYKNVLEQMRELSVVSSLKQISDELTVNLSGRSIAAAEFWADTLDRWAEELVASSEAKACKGGSKDSLPPEVVLKIMKVLREEMELREETREMEAVRPAILAEEFKSKTKPLEMDQEELRQRIDEVTIEISELPDSQANFGNELQLLTRVSDVMRQARGILSRPETGAEAIAAETEVIELLLQSNRPPPKGGGGGGSSPGGGGSAKGPASLTDVSVGEGSEPDGGPAQRAVGQSTGKAGREFPEEFRMGLDNYFNNLDRK